MVQHRYADVLAEHHDDDHLVKFEELLEAAVDLDKIPDEYLICASYDSGLQVCTPMQHQHGCLLGCNDWANALFDSRVYMHSPSFTCLLACLLIYTTRCHLVQVC